MKSKAEILEEIKTLGFPDNEVVVTCDQFFENENYSESCIGVNIFPYQPEKELFYKIFKQLIETKKADEIFVRIADVDDPDEWFYSDTVYVIGNIKLDELTEELESLFPTEIHEGFMYGKPINIDDVENYKNVFSVWWD